MPVYLIRAGENGPVKIGYSADPVGRLAELQISHYETLRIIRLLDGGEVEEAGLHLRFSDLHLRGEWHSFSRLMMGDVGLVETVVNKSEQIEPPTSLTIDVSDTAAEIGGRIRTARRTLGLTQSELARHLGIARSTLASIELGHDLPGRNVLLRASAFFEVPLVAA